MPAMYDRDESDSGVKLSLFFVLKKLFKDVLNDQAIAV